MASEKGRAWEAGSNKTLELPGGGHDIVVRADFHNVLLVEVRMHHDVMATTRQLHRLI